MQRQVRTTSRKCGNLSDVLLQEGDQVSIFSQSAAKWVLGTIVEFLENHYIRVEYEVFKVWYGKVVHLDSSLILIPDLHGDDDPDLVLTDHGESEVCSNTSASDYGSPLRMSDSDDTEHDPEGWPKFKIPGRNAWKQRGRHQKRPASKGQHKAPSKGCRQQRGDANGFKA